MAEYRTMRVTFWNDPYIEELSPFDKLLYIYLFSCPSVNNLGVLEVTRKKISFETGLSVEDVQAGLSRMQEAGKILTEGSSIWMVNFVKHQTTTSPKLIQSLKKLIPSVSSESIRKEICARYPHIIDGCDTMPIPSDTVSIPSGELERELERELEVKTIAPPTRSERDFDSFWQSYPRKKSKGHAQKTWDKLRKAKSLPELDVILDAIAAAKAGHDWQRNAGEFVPYPATWLNARGWEDEGACDLGRSGIFAGAI